jgi:hypothetical protein
MASCQHIFNGDLLFEIVNHLDPIDIISLRRVNKEIRKTLGNNSTLNTLIRNFYTEKIIIIQDRFRKYSYKNYFIAELAEIDNNGSLRDMVDFLIFETHTVDRYYLGYHGKLGRILGDLAYIYRDIMPMYCSNIDTTEILILWEVVKRLLR